MFNLHLSVEQSSRERQEEERINDEANLNTDLYAAGDFDGGIGIDPDPQMWRNLAYRSGFLTGIGRHYDKKYQIDIEAEPF